jgi:CPA2 family monovalent cation:H+ antiporter-2
MDLPILKDILIIFGLSIAVLFVCLRLKLPTIVGFLVTGILAGPHGLGFIEDVGNVDRMAEVGVVLLLFTIGIEFSLKDFFRIRRVLLVGGSLQVLLTILFFCLADLTTGVPFNRALFMGFLFSLSSTAIVLRLLQERAEVDTPHGRTILGILIYQDLMIVPMILLVPILAGAGGDLTASLALLLVKGAAVLLVVLGSARWLVPRLLFQVTRTRNREIFLLTVVVIGLAVAALTQALGLSVALGAFFAGLIISESEYSDEALAHILPFRDLFISFFFVSVGMLLDLHFFFQHAAKSIFFVFLVISGKTVIAALAAFFLGYPLRTMILTGFALSQVGEFAFVLSHAGVRQGLITPSRYQFFLSVSILTMIATPFVYKFAVRLGNRVMRLPLPHRLATGLHDPGRTAAVSRRDHLIIIGFGVGGRHVSQAAKASGIPYVIIEMNPETVRSEREKGEPIFYGDATHEAVLQHAGVREARILVITIPHASATRAITARAKLMNPVIHVVARTRYVQEVAPLHELGADEVVPEEFETSVEIFARVLKNYLVPREEIEQFIGEVRAGGYEMLRTLSPEAGSCYDLRHCLPGVNIHSIRVGRGAPVTGLTLGQTEMRKRHGVTVLAYQRQGVVRSNPDVDMVFLEGDLVFIMGTPERMSAVIPLFEAREVGPPPGG